MTQENILNIFDDYLDLKAKDLAKYNYIFFYGNTSVGKSSYIRFLNKTNSPVVDEIEKFSQLLLPFFIKKKKSTVFVASRLPIGYFIFYLIFAKTLFINLNKNQQKIINELEKRNIDYNYDSINIFIKDYGNSYKNLKNILEAYPSRSFVYSLKQYQISRKIQSTTSNKSDTELAKAS